MEHTHTHIRQTHPHTLTYKQTIANVKFHYMDEMKKLTLVLIWPGLEQAAVVWPPSQTIREPREKHGKGEHLGSWTEEDGVSIDYRK